MNLQEIVRLSNELRSYLIENDGEVSEEMAKGLAIVEEKLPEKVDSYRFIIQDMESEAEKYKERADELLRISKGYKTFVEKLKENLKFACKAMGKTELFGNNYKWKLQNAKAAVVIDDESVVPGKYKEVVTTFKINKNQIFEDIQNGVAVEGCHLETSSHVRAYPLGVRR